MKLICIFSLIIIPLCLSAQDGSDIKYIDEKEIGSELIGEYIHIDFYDNSFGDVQLKSKKTDIVSLDFNGVKKFVEIRNDDGYNNWFNQQYLESKRKFDGKRLRVQKMKLLTISEESITVKLFGHFFRDDAEEFDPFLTDTISVNRTIINQILVDLGPQIREGMSIYRIYAPIPDFTNKQKPECYYCLEPNEDNLFESPLISDYHIKEFDYKGQKIVLTDLGKKRVENLEIPVWGMPVALTLNGEVIYGFWFWNMGSSIGCDRVYANPKLDFKLKFGLPNGSGFGLDPRFDQRLKEYSNMKR